jgi:hypothetical protein
MTSTKVNNKRKPVAPPEPLHIPNNVVKLLPVEDMIIHAPGCSPCIMKKLKYKGCPNFKHGTLEHHPESNIVDADRDAFIRQLYSLLNSNVTASTYTHFNNVINYLRWMDAEELSPIDGDHLHPAFIQKYVAHWNSALSGGEKSFRSWENARSTIRWHLKQLGRDIEAQRLPSLNAWSFTSRHYKAYDLESELKPVSKRMFSAYNELVKHFNSGTSPDIHPLYNEDLFLQEARNKNWTPDQKAKNKKIFVRAVSNNWNNIMIRIAMMLSHLLTGMNSSPMGRMRISDINFSCVHEGKYLLQSTKGRANHLEIDNAIGFSKYTKEFIEKWRAIALVLNKGNTDGPLFPCFTNGENISFYSDTPTSPQPKINQFLVLLGLSTLNASRLRKTKLDALMRTTESVYLVSQSGNNSIGVVARSYTDGVESDHENNLGASMEAKFNIAKGNDVKASVSQAKFNHADILSDYEYQSLRKNTDRNHESRTPTGVRCQDNTKGAAEFIGKSLRRAGIKTSAKESICTDFLDCFDCDQHALVADVDDIWLMLSFKETLQQMQQLPAINSIQEDKYNKLANTIDDILCQFRDKSKNNYVLADEKNKASPHPLYSSAHSLNDLLEMFS